MTKEEKIIEKILTLFDNLDCELIYHNNYELIISVVLSAQTTDKAVNKETPSLFIKYPDFYSLSMASIDEVKDMIKRIGLANVKAKNIVNLSKMMVEKYSNILPNTLDELIKLPGVGRKTANVVLQLAYNIPSMAVDTHVHRVSKRLGFIKNDDDVLTCELKLKKQLPICIHNKANMAILLFGRYYCKSINPQCNNCIVKEYCKSVKS